MGQREFVLDGLAWAGLSEDARVARLAAMLVRQESAPHHTQTHIKDAIRGTAPPYGRQKYIFAKLYGEKGDEDGNGAVEGEILRQYKIYAERKAEQDEFEAYLRHMSKRSTRLNMAYAGAFSRPPYEPSRSCPKEIAWNYAMGHDHPNRDRMTAWQKGENARDKGDKCLGITHQDGHVVALVSHENMTERCHIAVRLKKGEITRTYLRDDCEDLVQAAVSLGGPKVRAAISKGKRVRTDWAGRRSFIYHDGSDHEEPKVEEVPWQAMRYEDTVIEHSYGGRSIDTEEQWLIVHGKSEKVVPVEEDGFDWGHTPQRILLGP